MGLPSRPLIGSLGPALPSHHARARIIGLRPAAGPLGATQAAAGWPKQLLEAFPVLPFFPLRLFPLPSCHHSLPLSTARPVPALAQSYYRLSPTTPAKGLSPLLVNCFWSCCCNVLSFVRFFFLSFSLDSSAFLPLSSLRCSLTELALQSYPVGCRERPFRLFSLSPSFHSCLAHCGGRPFLTDNINSLSRPEKTNPKRSLRPQYRHPSIYPVRVRLIFFPSAFRLFTRFTRRGSQRLWRRFIS